MQGQPSCYVFGADELMLRHLGLSTWTLLSYFPIILSTPSRSLRLFLNTAPAADFHQAIEALANAARAFFLHRF
jgi:hypothetical protein